MWRLRQRGHSVLMLLLVPVMTGSVSNKGNKHKPWIEAEYQGIVMENDRTVLLNPPLFAIDKDAPLHYAGEICGFKIHGQNVPFEALVVDKLTGEGLIRAKEPVNCEAQREHTFSMQAHDCGENAEKSNVKKSHKAVVHVRVNDVNEFVPAFTERLYRVSVSEGKLYESVAKVQALDGDCSPQYSQICFYEILTPGVPFTIDNDGNIKNTEKLDVRRETLYTFTVTAYDCGKKRAVEDAQVEIHVKPSCRPAWHGLTRHMEYAPGSGPKALFPNIRLEACEQTLWNIEALVELETSHVAKGCDRDNYSERNLRKLCGVAPGELDLLPPPSPLSDWTRELQTVPSAGPSPVYSFNGTSAASPPPGLLGPHLADGFTLSFWLLRAYDRPPGLETLICSTVPTDTGYTHYSVRIRSCRLYLVYWPQVENVQPMMFYWRPDQLCDHQWHHYTLNVQFPTVTLYVDAASYEPSLAHDPALLHPPRPEARLVVAACWQDDATTGGSNQTANSRVTPGVPWRLGNYLQGLVAGLTLRPGPLESRQVLECLYACREGLDFSDFDSLGKGMKVHISPSQSLLSLEGEDPESFSQALGHVTYRNSLRYATPGPRPLRLTTSIKCLSEGPCLPIPTIEGSVTVLPPDSPAIVLSGTPHLARPAAEFEGPTGVNIFPRLHITSSVQHHLEGSNSLGESPSAVQETLISDEIIHNLDSCEVVVLGEALDLQREALLLDHAAYRQRGLLLENTTAVVSVSGVESIAVYESLIREIRYRVRPGAALYERKFRLHCSEMNRHYISNEFTVEVNVVHSVKAPIHPSHIHAPEEFRQHASQVASELTGHGLTNMHRTSVVPGAATIIIVVCVGFLVLMVVLGIVRIQTLQLQRPQEVGRAREQEAFWDDSALTIVINPMESYKGGQAEDGGGETVGADPVTPGPGGRGR